MNVKVLLPATTLTLNSTFGVTVTLTVSLTEIAVQTYHSHRTASVSASPSLVSLITGGPSSDKECESGAVRLVGGVSGSVGRLEMCASGVWGRVCNRLQYWGTDNAMVVCRQLGFSTEGNS